MKEREKKGSPVVSTSYLDDALDRFSGYVAIDEVYDGPFCILSIVDNRRFHRLMFEVLDHSPAHADISKFLTRFRDALRSKALPLQGITTDASPLYPEPLKILFPGVPHQICRFHMIKEISKAILKALAKVRREFAATVPKVTRGRAGDNIGEKTARRKKKRIEKKVADLFENRYLLVQRNLSVSEEKTLKRITRGFPVLRQFREIMDQVYGLFDRRCKMSTGLKKLAALREKVQGFRKVYSALNKLFSANMEKALVFLDEKLLPSTSNAVERGNRRFRKMQKSVYRIRTLQHIYERISLDMMRDAKFRHRLGIIDFLKGFRHG